MFFDNDKLIFCEYRKKTDDVEAYCFSGKAHYSANPIIYDCEQDTQYIDFNAKICLKYR